MSNIAIVTSRMESSRLPGKAMLSFGGKPMFLYIIDRIYKYSKLIDKIVGCTTTTKINNIISDITYDNNYKCYREPPGYLIQKMLNIATIEGADTIVRITGDNPFTCPFVLDRLLQNLGDYDYIRMGGLPIGVTAEVFRTKTLLRVLERCYSNYDTSQQCSDAFTFFYTKNSNFNVKVLEMGNDFSNYSVTVDTLFDYVKAINIVNKLNIDYTVEDLIEVLIS